MVLTDSRKQRLICFKTMDIDQFGERWQRAQGEARGEIVGEMMRTYGWSKQTCYRKLEAAGYSSGKRKRCDAGESSIDKADLQLIASMMQEGRRANGKQILGIEEALLILRLNGREINVSPRQIARRLQEERLDVKTLKSKKRHTRMRSLHPNHVWQIDPSFCVMYYLPGGKQVIIEKSELNKNKHGLYEKLAQKNRKLWRYVCTDHNSGYTVVRYYQEAGETQENLYDFFLYCARRKKGEPFCGVPKILLMDKGSAGTARAMLGALQALGVKVLTHARGAANVKGSVENGNNRVECSFEAHLRFDPLHSLEALNQAASAYFAAYNANAFYAEFGRDHRLNRNGKKVRLELWRKITASQLRLLPDLAICRQLLVQGAQEKTVGRDACIRMARHTFAAKGGLYSLDGLEVVPGQKVRVQCLAYDGQAILVHYRDHKGEAQAQRIAAPLRESEDGFDLSAAVIGEEYKTAPLDRNEKTRKELEHLAYPDGRKKNARPFAHLNDGAGLVSHNAIAANVSAYQRKNLLLPASGRQIGLGAVQLHEAEYSLSEALAHLKTKLENNGYEYDRALMPDLVKGQMKGERLKESLLEVIYQQITEVRDECLKQA